LPQRIISVSILHVYCTFAITTIEILQADYLTTEQRQSWANYLTEQNIGQTRFAFFSAIQEDEEEDEEDEEEQEEGEDDADDAGEDDEKEEEEEKKDVAVEKVMEQELGAFPDPCEILTSSRLLQLFRSFKRHESGRSC
jgi:hypothetical protein